MRVTLLRHGESAANVSRRWQGHQDTPLTERGRRQVAAAAERLAEVPFDLVVSSDLGRARETAAALGRPFEVDPAWREVDIGAWEGLTREEVSRRFPEEMAALAAGQAVALGGGETLPEFRARITAALDRLLERSEEGRRALVVTHGGAVAGAVGAVLGLGWERRPALGRLTNASLTTIAATGTARRLERYNDAAHLGVLTGWAAERLAAGDTVISLIRHGETEANRTGRWQGLTDGELTETGALQVEALAGWYGRVDALYASRLRRARRTAGVLAAGGLVGEHAHLHEMSLGEWEDRTVDEIRGEWADLWRRIYEDGEDLPRGVSGEAFAEVATRMRSALAELAGRHAGTRIGVVSHGGAIRAFVADLLGLDHASRGRLVMPRNTSVTHVVVGEEGEVVADYDVAPHLDGDGPWESEPAGSMP